MSQIENNSPPPAEAGPPVAVPAWGVERRRAVRTGLTRQVTLYPFRANGLGRPLRASLNDVSSIGLGLTCLGELPVGSRFVLRFNAANAAPALQVYQVVRCRASGGASQVGALFEEIFTGINGAVATQPPNAMAS